MGHDKLALSGRCEGFGSDELGGWLACLLLVLFCVIVYKLGTLLGTRLGTLLGTLDFVVFIDFFLLVGTMELINRVK